MALVVGSNSYGSQAEADTYFEDSINGGIWTAFTSTLKDQGLVTATRQLELQSWQGEKEVPSQDLDFPRTGLIDCEGNSVTANESLEIAKEGQFEYAFALLQNPSILTTTNNTGTNTKKIEAGSAKITYFRPERGSKYPLPVLNIMKCFFLGNSSSDATSMSVSGNCDSSSFTGDDRYGLIEGFK